MRRFVDFFMTTVLVVSVTSACAVVATAQYAVESDFQADTPSTPAKDLSGIDCLPVADDSSRHCIVINDENRAAQVAVIKGDRIRPGAMVALIADKPPADIVGIEPAVKCSAGSKRFKELDGEGVAYAAPYFYIVGSHGCSRQSRAYRASSFVLMRMEVDVQRMTAGQGDFVKSTRASFRLSEVLGAGPLGSKFGADLMERDGLNVEGLAVVGATAFFGIRSPEVGGNAYLAAVDRHRLFSADGAALAARYHALALGRGAGVRDLAALPDGRLLVLSGPTKEQADVAYRVFLFDPASGKVEALGALDDTPRNAKAEALVVLDSPSGFVNLLVLFDGALNGAPRRYRLALPAVRR